MSDRASHIHAARVYIRARIANAARRRGHAVKGDLTKAYRRAAKK